MQIAGQIFTEQIFKRIVEAVNNPADLSRSALSRLVCEWLNWRNPSGQLREKSPPIGQKKKKKKSPASASPIHDLLIG